MGQRGGNLHKASESILSKSFSMEVFYGSFRSFFFFLFLTGLKWQGESLFKTGNMGYELERYCICVYLNLYLSMLIMLCSKLK